MKIAIKGLGSSFRLHDPSVEVIAVVLSAEDRRNIARMADDATIYCAYPDDADRADVDGWLDRVKESIIP